MSTESPALPSLFRPTGVRSKAESFTWRLYAFEVAQHGAPRDQRRRVASRRVLVYAPFPDAADSGVGAGNDEICRPVSPGLFERIGASCRPRREEIADFYEIIGSALSTGAGMTLALSMAARSAQSAMMRGIVGALRNKVAHGEELHEAMRCFPQQFTPMQVAMVEAAAATGLDKAGALLTTLSRRLERDRRVWRTFIGAVAYPASLVLLTAIGAVVLDVWALPPMVDLFHTLGGRLPPLTRGFYAVAQFLRINAAVVFPAAAAAVIGTSMFAPRLLRSPFAQRWAVRLWVVGPIVQWLALIRALGTFILLKQSGARVRDQFTMAAAAAGNCVVGDFFHACYRRISDGDSIEEAFLAERHRLGNDGIRLAGKMEIGMAGADLPTLLQRTVAELDERAEARLALLPHLLRWPLLLGCSALIGVVALAIVLPYPNLIADVAQQQVAR